MTGFTDASHNLLFRLNPELWREDLAKSSAAELVGYQEVGGDQARRTLAAWCEEKGRGLFHPPHTDCPISWDLDAFRQVKLDGVPVEGANEVHLSALLMGIRAKFNPSRDFTWVGLVHKESGKKLLRINVHPIAGALRQEDAPEHNDSDELSAWKDWGIAQYWLDVVSFTAAAMSLQVDGKKATKGFWDAILLGGDFNAAMSNERRWYYPGSLLDGLYESDSREAGLDHLVRTRGSDLRAGKRWTKEGHTDHRLHFVNYEVREVEDFPRDV